MVQEKYDHYRIQVNQTIFDPLHIMPLSWNHTTLLDLGEYSE
jgi:hypothetical protein